MNKLAQILGIQFPNEIEISSITNTTDKVKEGSIFFALKGTQNHGSKYIDEAFEKGAKLAIHNDKNFYSSNENIIYVKDLQSSGGEKIFRVLEAFYKINNFNNHNYYAFTGTNGKTTSAYLCHQLLTKKGFSSIYIGTIGTQYNTNPLDQSLSKKTTPDIFELFEIFNFYKIKNNIAVCIEISSHALDQNRLENIKYFKSSSILNIGSDHLDYHKNIENYAQSKLKIFSTESESKFINQKILNENPNIFIEDSSLTKVSNNPSTEVYYEILECSFKKSLFKIIQNNEKDDSIYQFETSIFPKFNIANLIFAICSTGLSNFDKNKMNKLDFLKLPKGRSDFIKDIPANIIIDYAHNPEGFLLFLSSLQDFFDNLVVVFGCGGNRDRSKRPLMLNAALKYADKVIFTSDNSRNEEFSEILSDATASNNSKSKIDVIEDRKAAIIHGTNLIKKDDCLVILGKGHEETQEKDGQILFFSDHEVVNEIYN